MPPHMDGGKDDGDLLYHTIADSEGGGSNEGVNPKLFGPCFWKLLFSLANAIDTYLRLHAGNSGDTDDIHVEAREMFIGFSSVLPCYACRISSLVFLQNPELDFTRMENLSSYVEFVYWLRVQVNRKLFKQRIELPENSAEDVEALREEWRRYTIPRSRVKPIQIQSAETFRCFLTCFWWMSKSNKVRPNIIRFTLQVSRVMRLIGHYGMSIWLEDLWRIAGGDDGSSRGRGKDEDYEIPRFGNDLRLHLEASIRGLKCRPRQRDWLCVWRGGNTGGGGGGFPVAK